LVVDLGVLVPCSEPEDPEPLLRHAGIEPGKSRPWSVSSVYQSTGRYRAVHVGVTAGNADFVCAKPAGWKELGK
jgi:hypothetical protein